MESIQIIETIGLGRIVAILRGDFHGREEEITDLLSRAGVTAVEVTLNSPDPFGAMKRLTASFGSVMAIGAGTVMQPAEVEKAAAAGARFIVSPNRNIQVIEATKRHDLVSLPGCFTPSEVIEALDAGADAVKLFPVGALGSTFIRAMGGPLPHARFLPTGGITPLTARGYIAAGAWAVGVGSELVSSDLLEADGFTRLRMRAEAFVAAVSEG